MSGKSTNRFSTSGGCRGHDVLASEDVGDDGCLNWCGALVAAQAQVAADVGVQFDFFETSEINIIIQLIMFEMDRGIEQLN